ncbi:MAG TPA: imidazoleglycerol-phosphate dehydratase, partial [Candidatus Limnocylindria bacterium]|nr:imidazoleglycerol-phosphate dehydratase [Candidatus Limnocylindria bacterium]
MGRRAQVSRKTKESDITISLEIDGIGQAAVETGMPFFNHMLDSFSRHGFFNIEIRAKGDLEV